MFGSIIILRAGKKLLISTKEHDFNLHLSYMYKFQVSNNFD